jgi:hypothetical protein
MTQGADLCSVKINSKTGAQAGLRFFHAMIAQAPIQLAGVD